MKKNAFRRPLIGLAVAACFAGVVHANPTGPAVVSGSASFAASGNTLTVTNVPGTIINWQAFSIRPDEITRFIQSGAASAVLNRVTGADQSAILGRLLSNGRVFLINPNGVVVGAGAMIDTAGFVASSLNLSNEDFLAGRFRFTDPGNAGKVTNAGTINARSGGPVYLVAPTVENHGVITAPNGDIILAAGKSVELVSAANPSLRVQVQAGGEAVNVGQLIAESGRVGIYGAAIRNAGMVSADSASVNAAGNVVLKASRDVTLENTSVVSANGTQGGTVHVQAESGTLLADGRVEAKGAIDKGGDVKLLGTQVGLVGNAAVDASGARGGGTVLVGGDYQGKNPDVQNASRTYVGPDATINADAHGVGDGGRVVVWADEGTQYYGHASARGGPGGGDGGFAEVSAKGVLDFAGTVDLRAPAGASGTLLLDPSNITISTGANSNITPASPFTSTGATSVLNTTTLQTALAGGNVIVKTSGAFAAAGGLQSAITGDNTAGDIDVANTITWNSANSLTLLAHDDVIIRAAITNNGTGALNIASGWNGATDVFATIKATPGDYGNGTGDTFVRAGVRLFGGSFTALGRNVAGIAAGTVNTTGGTGLNGGNVEIVGRNGGAVNLAGAITANGGAAGGGAGRNGGAVSITGVGVTTAGVTASGSNAAAVAGAAGGAGGTIQLTSTNGISAGALAASGGTAGTGPANGGAGGTITVSNSTAGTITTGALTARAGAATTTGSSAAGSVGITNAAAGAFLQTGGIDTRGNNNGAGGAVILASAGALQFGAAATIQTGGGTALAGTAGRNGGAVNLSGTAVTTTGAITTSGSTGNGANQAGGSAGAITATSTGAINVSAGTLTATGGNAGGGNANGGSGGSATLDGGAAATITLANVTTTGGNRAGTGTAGAGGNVAVADAALLAANTTITATGGSAGVGVGGNVSFGGTLNSSGASRTLAINTNGATTFGGAVGGTTALTSLTTNAGGTTSLAGNVTTTGNQSYGDAVTLTGNAVLTGATPTFSSTVAGAGNDLALNFTGTTTVNGATFTGIRNLATGNGGTTQLAGAITTSGTQTYGDAVTLTGATTLASSGNQAISFGSTVNGARTLAVNTTGATSFGGAVGGVTALTSLTTNAGGTTSLGGNVSTTGLQSYGDAVTLTGGGTKTLASTGNLAIGFASTLDGAATLVVNTTGATTFGGAVGGTTALTSLTTNAGGTTAINGGAVTTTGAQTYGDAVTLGAGTTFASTGSGNVAFNSTLNSAGANRAVTVNTSGTMTFGGAVGGVLALASLTTDAAGTTAINGGSVRTTGAQTYNDTVTTSGATTLTATTGGNITASNSTNNFSGNLALSTTGSASIVDSNALAFGASSIATLTAQTLAGDITLNGAVTASGGGDSIVLASGGNFVNNVGAAALNPGAGRWLVYSTNPASDTRGGLVYDFKQYNATYGVTPVAGAGKGLLYSVAPTITTSLSGTATRTYDGTIAAPIGGLSLAAGAGAIDGDTVSVAFSAATYDTKHVGSGKPVTASGVTVTATNGGKPVYGYQAAPATANVGTINAAPLTVTAQTDSRGYDGTTASGVAPVVTGTLYDPVGTAPTQNYDTKHVGTGKTLTASGLVVNDGNGGANYSVSYVNNATGVITAAPLTVTAQTDSRGYDGTTGSGVAPAVTGTLYDPIGTAPTQSYDTKHVGAGKTLSASGLVMNDGNGGANYSVSYVNSATGVITAAPLTVTAQTDSRVYDGTTNSNVAPVVAGALYDPVGAAPTQSYDTKNVGTGKTLTASGLVVNDGNGGNNYTITYVTDSTGVIVAASLTITADNKSRPYGDANPPLTATFTGLVPGDTPADIAGLTITTPAVPASNVGAYAITPAGGVNANYTMTYVNGQLTINPAPLTITADDASRMYGFPNPAFTATAAGFKLGQGFGSLAGTLAFSTPATTTSPVGAYPITPSGVSSPNYAITFVDGRLAVGQGIPPADQALITAVERSESTGDPWTTSPQARGAECLVLERPGVRRVLNRCY
jgi:filamentous hemagglutinin family protein